MSSFTDGVGADKVYEMAEPATPVPRSHPLLRDRARLEKIKNNMHVQIQLVLHRRRVSDDVALLLPGGGSVTDVLQDALVALLRTDPANVRTTWEALGTAIARNKAKDALSKATRGRRKRGAEPGAPDEVTLVALDEDVDAVDTSLGSDPETAFVAAEQLRVLLRLARATLTERESQIFHAGFYRTKTDKELGEQLGISGQAAGQQRRRILKNLYEVARRDKSFPTLNVSDEGS
ncbi:RNA polymerase sigma factor [Tenggerimyces flavus]|uniref:RNA polymerase sigma factor n=1 Tax=Tenggerimyces flavus TaxID=1708749 RepID=A0ABV7YFM6_9ACTN|nr:sigma-70 family RNA polymerase sigma factor [Tenggerimyces flavus]MBM7789179.1 RNA polymerase sigma factor (sigma-70 family) [Tenggerimyces flavus]